MTAMSVADCHSGAHAAWGGPVGCGMDIDEEDKDWFPLMMATAVNQVKVVELLLKNGATVDKTDKQGRTSLALAVKEGHVEPMAMLLSHGAALNVRDKAGRTPRPAARRATADDPAVGRPLRRPAPAGGAGAGRWPPSLCPTWGRGSRRGCTSR